VIVGIVGEAERHRAALEQIGGDRVVVELCPPPRLRTFAEIDEMGERVLADAAEFEAAGLQVEWLRDLTPRATAMRSTWCGWARAGFGSCCTSSDRGCPADAGCACSSRSIRTAGSPARRESRRRATSPPSLARELRRRSADL
jgi:hypothetical protein